MVISEKFSGFSLHRTGNFMIHNCGPKFVVFLAGIRTRNSKGLGRKADLSLMKICIVICEKATQKTPPRFDVYSNKSNVPGMS